MATGLPANVASGELITSVWGNAVVDELERIRGANGGLEMWQAFSHGGGSANVYGTYDNGVTTLGPYTFPVRVTVLSHAKAGFGGSGTTWASDIVRMSDNSGVAQSAPQYAHPALYANHTIPTTYDVAIGLAAGFKTRTIFSGSDATPITLYYSAAGLYLVHRTDY